MDTDKQLVDTIRDIFTKVRDLPADERAKVLTDLCGGNTDLLKEVESLLQVYDSADGLLQHDASGAILADDASLTGTMINGYRLIERIGEGGFGEVFRAEQTVPIHREVALKIIKLGMDTKNVVARFGAEREALARMNHPGIAQVYDAGITETGRPYFVMELVRGIPFINYCDQHRLSLPERLTLFCTVCEAVQHAHQKGILHRDLKPSNILITEENGTPQPKIIDFGVAKSLRNPLTEQTLATLQEMLIGTPLYMSPEQLDSEIADIDTRADIYSLGIILYELVAGITPLEGELTSPMTIAEMRQALAEKTIPRPSRRFRTLGPKTTTIANERKIKPPSLERLLRGDLDWVVMKAIERERDRRYADVGAFARDLEHYLNNEPVSAGPPRLRYRCKKFIERHRTGVVLGTGMALALVVGLVVALSGLTQARWERDRAVFSEKIAAKERNQAELLAAEAMLEKGQAKLEAGDSWGLLDMVEAYRLAEHNPICQKAVGRRWSTWHEEWSRRTIAVRPSSGALSPDFLHSVPISSWPPHNHASEIHLRDTLTGKPVTGPMVHESIVKGCAFSPEGRWLATVTEKGVIHLWDCATGMPVRPPSVTGVPEFNRLLFSPDGRYLVAFSKSGTDKVALFRFSDQFKSPHLLEHRYPVGGARFSSDGELLAVSSKPDLQLWRTEDLLPAVPPLAVTFNHVVDFSDDGVWLAYDSKNSGGIDLFDIRTLQTSGILAKPACTDIGFSHGGGLLAIFDWGCNLELWKTDSPAGPYAGHQFSSRLRGLSFNRDDSLLAVGEVSGRVWILRSRDGNIVQTLHTDRRPMPEFLPNRVLAAHTSYATYFWDLDAAPFPAGALEHDALAHALAFDSSGNFLAVGGEDELRIWKMRPQPQLKQVVPLSGSVLALTFSEAEGRFVAFSNDGSLIGVDPLSGMTKTSARIAWGSDTSAYFSPDARKLVMVFPYLTRPLVVDTRTGAIQWLKRKGGTLSVAFRRDSLQMAVGSAGWMVSLFETGGDTADFIRKADFDGWVEGVAYHPEGQLLAVCEGGITLHLFNPETNQKLFSAYKPTLAKVNFLCFSPDGTLLATAGSRPDGGYGVELWHVDQEKGLFRAGSVLPCERGVWCLAFSPDSGILVAGGLGSTRFWKLPTEPKNFQEIDARTTETLGFRMNENKKPVYVDSPTNGVDEIRGRLMEMPALSITPLEAALRQPPGKRLAARQQLLDQHPESTVYQRLLGKKYADLMHASAKKNNWNNARQHAVKAIRLGRDEPHVRYAHALLCLAAGDRTGYRTACRDMIEQYGASEDPFAIKQVGWTASLVPGAIEDYSDLAERLRKAVPNNPDWYSEACRFYLGAVLVRAGRYAEALVEFEKVGRCLETKGTYMSFSPVYHKFFLAICHAHLGHMDTARQWYDSAAMDVQNQFQAPEGARPSSPIPWNRRLTFELLQDEARSSLNPVNHDTDSVRNGK